MIESKNVLYDRIEALCLERGIKVGALSERIGIHRNTLGYLKRGEHGTLSVDVLVKIADYFGVSADCLLGRSADRRNEVVINVPTDGMDEALEKARELNRLLTEAREIIRYLGGTNERRDSDFSE